MIVTVTPAAGAGDISKDLIETMSLVVPQDVKGMFMEAAEATRPQRIAERNFIAIGTEGEEGVRLRGTQIHN